MGEGGSERPPRPSHPSCDHCVPAMKPMEPNVLCVGVQIACAVFWLCRWNSGTTVTCGSLLQFAHLHTTPPHCSLFACSTGAKAHERGREAAWPLAKATESDLDRIVVCEARRLNESVRLPGLHDGVCVLVCIEDARYTNTAVYILRRRELAVHETLRHTLEVAARALRGAQKVLDVCRAPGR